MRQHVISKVAAIPNLRQHIIVRKVKGGLSAMLQDRMTLGAFLVLIFMALLGIFGPSLAPYNPDQFLINPETGQLLEGEPPSLSHPLGTTSSGQDVLSRILVGSRPTLIAGLVGGVVIISIGMTIGVTAGYMGGRIDDVLMRFTDTIYGIPLIPFAIVVVGLFELGFYGSVLLVAAFLWRSSARVIRAQVLTLRERPFIQAARASGASHFRIIMKHIIPNVTTIGLLFFALGAGASILIQAGLAFIGISDPFVPSWGVIMRNAYSSGQMDTLWWWSLPAGFLIAITVASLFLFGRGYERVVESSDDEDVAVGI